MVPMRILGRRHTFVWGFALSVFCGIASAQNQAPEITVGETPQQVNDRIRTLSMGSKSAKAHDYYIGNGDLLDISVFDVPELTRELRVSQTGTISIPLVPVRLQVTGLTEIQVEQKIAEVLEANGLVSHPEVAVVVKEHRSQPITIVGAVFHPMVYQADRAVTLLEALAEAGGIAADAGDTVIVSRTRATAFTEVSNPQPISQFQAPGSGEPPALTPSVTPESAAKAQTSSGTNNFPAAEVLPELSDTTADRKIATEVLPGRTIITINLNDLLETGDTRNNIQLQAGDVVTVPHAGIVYVLGAVNRPGGFVLANDRSQLTTMKVLSLAGGLTKIAKVQHAVIIRKDDQGKQTETEVDLKKVLARQTEDITMRASDILYIPDDRTKEVLLRAAELGIAVGTAVAVFRLAYH